MTPCCARPFPAPNCPMRRIALPVRLSFADDERSSIAAPEVASEARHHLVANPQRLVRFEPRTGHNISLHSAGCDFHHGMIDWIETSMR